MSKKETPMNHLYAILQIIKKTNKRKHEDVTNRAFTYWFEINIKRYLEEEENCILKAFDEGQEYEYQYHINSAPKFDSETYYKETYDN
jgi:hypothetical protein